MRKTYVLSVRIPTGSRKTFVLSIHPLPKNMWESFWVHGPNSYGIQENICFEILRIELRILRIELKIRKQSR
jgi:hypothetical protein